MQQIVAPNVKKYAENAQEISKKKVVKISFQVEIILNSFY